MPDKFRFWTHGVNVQPEFNDRVQLIQRASWGTRIRQAAGSDNFFLLGIPSATKLDDEFVDLREVYFQGTINNDAVVNLVSVRMIETAGEAPNELFRQEVNWIGAQLDETFNFESTWCKGPVVLTLRVRFESEDGEVVFLGAGARFDER